MITEKTMQRRKELKKHLDAIVGHFESITKVMKEVPKISREDGTRYRALDNKKANSNVLLNEAGDFIIVNYQIPGQKYTIKMGRTKTK